jgi:hypothetical protein
VVSDVRERVRNFRITFALYPIFRFVFYFFPSIILPFSSYQSISFVLVDFVSLSLVSFHFVFISLISFRFVDFASFRFAFVDFVSFRFLSFSLISFCFVSFRFYFVSHFIGTPFVYREKWNRVNTNIFLYIFTPLISSDISLSLCNVYYKCQQNFNLQRSIPVLCQKKLSIYFH